ncbi:MAG: hypothetical protein H7X78_05595 [Methyloceanibacter sp.]|jgi:hypothetical protein|nr:hypothetical protein [Methyloceanibacter sp.]
MRFLIGALAFLVICAIFASPAALLLGWVQFSDLQIVDKNKADPAPAPSPPVPTR